jgi:intracellular multiplication protein IcmB
MTLSNFFSSVAGSAGMISKKYLPSYCYLESCHGDTIVAKDGSLVTIIRVDGTKQMMGSKELINLVDRAKTNMNPYFNTTGHAMQVWFCRDPSLSSQMLKDMMQSPRNTADKLGLSLDDLFSEREKYLQDFIIHESFYIALWTRLSILSKQELINVRASQKPPKFWPSALDAQAPYLAARQMTNKHLGFVGSFCEDIKSLGIRVERLKGHAALKAIKASIYPDTTGSDWRPYLPGDEARPDFARPAIRKEEYKVPWPRRAEISNKDISHMLWPRLDEQLFDKGAEIINDHIVRIGRYYYSCTDMSMGPQDLQPFSELLGRLREGEFPWRVSFLIEGEGLGKFNMKGLLASIMGFSNKDNKTIKDALDALAAHKRSGEAITRTRISFATWAPANTVGDIHDIEKIEEYSSRLQRAVEGWGNCTVSPTAGDSLAGTMSSALGLDIASTATPGAVPLEDILYMLPWLRDASPFVKGSVLFRTPDKRAWLFQPGSSLQDTTIDVVFAPPGRGKSVLLNTVNLAFCLSPLATGGTGGAKLPRLAIIDIGHSSSGLISLLKEALPPQRRHEVEHKRMIMDRRYAINPFDTQLGCRKPTANEKAFLVNFVTLLGTDANQKTAPSGLSDLVERTIDAAYETFSDMSRSGSPKPYTSGEDIEIDRKLSELDIVIEPQDTWWKCVDLLFEKGDIHTASLAQRYAVPYLGDLMQAVRSPQIIDIFGRVNTGTGTESLIDAFSRLISSSIRAYPILSTATKFDIGNARVVALDLDEVAPKGSGPAQKQTAMVYMLARYVLAKDFYVSEENLREIPEKYRQYHERIMRRGKESPKRIVFDEYHRTEGSPMVRDQVVRDMREGRKHGVQIALASQMLRDFEDDVLSMATGIWIFGVNRDSDVKEATKKFGLSTSAERAIPQYLNGPTRMGAPFLVLLQMKDGAHEHLLYNTLGPLELWAFSTTPEDVNLRKRLYEAIGANEARILLARIFPKGSAQDEIQNRLTKKGERGEEVDQEAQEGVIANLAKEMLARRQ